MGHEACMEKRRDGCSALMRKSEGNTPFGRPSCRWNDNIKINLKVIWRQGFNWINVGQVTCFCKKGDEHYFHKT